MLREFAIDPEAVNNWKDFRHFVDQCGVEHGRLISEFPRKWRRYVYEVSASCGDIERARIEERLKTIGDKLVASNRPYDGKKSWLSNAETQHLTRPFHAIISKSNPSGSPAICIADDIDENTACWRPLRQKIVSRRAAELAECAAPLFRISRELLLVDPYFKPTDGKWRRSLKTLLTRAVRENSKLERLEVHAEANLSAALWDSECRKELPKYVPKGYTLRVLRWRQRSDGPKLHARYILTEKGGLQIDHGLDDVSDSETTHVMLLDKAFHVQTWGRFQTATAIYDLIDEIFIKGALNV